MIYKTTFTAMKTYATINSLKFKWLEELDGYLVTLTDREITYQTYISKQIPSDELVDFETNFKPIPNLVAQEDTDGATIVRVKAARRGWTYGAIPIEFITSEIGSLYSKTLDGQDRAGITLKFYNSQGQEITDQGLLEINETGIVRTVVDFEPPYDYEVIGGVLRIGSDIAFDCRFWIIAVPDIPAGSGGSKEMAGGINLKFLAPQQSFHVDGRVSKTLVYSPTLHTNKLRFIFEHLAGTKTAIHINIELFRA